MKQPTIGSGVWLPVTRLEALMGQKETATLNPFRMLWPVAFSWYAFYDMKHGFSYKGTAPA